VDEISKNSIFIQTKDKFDDPKQKSQKLFENKKVSQLFFYFHTKRPKFQNRGMHYLPVILGFGG
jgi:hypothetical protein